MRWARGLLPLLALAGVLAACTGTTENLPPLLLAVGRLDPSSGNPEMALVEDNFASNQVAPRAISVVPASARPLTYPAVASDVVDRAGARTSMAVLTRQLGTSTPVSYLRFFNLQNIDPTNPVAFAEDTSRAVQLTGASGVFGSGPCFTSVTISLNGRYAALIDSPRACDATASDIHALYVLDTQTKTGTQLVSGQPVQVTPPFDDQAQSGETLYFLVQGTVGSAQLWSMPVPYDPSTPPSNTSFTLSTFSDSETQITLGSDATQLVAITTASTSPYTSTNTSSHLEAIDPSSGTTPTPTPSTINGAQALGLDPTGTTSQVVVAGYDQIAVHPTPAAPASVQTLSTDGLTGVAVALDPINQFAYVIGDGRIVLIDLLAVKNGQGSWYSTFTPDLTLPTNPATNNSQVTTVAWTRAKP